MTTDELYLLYKRGSRIVVDNNRYLVNDNATIYKRLYAYALEVLKDRAKSVDEIKSFDPTTRGEFLEVLK